MATVEHEAVREVVPVTTADVLNRAADLLEEFDWCQNDMGSKEEGRMCAGGAIAEAWRDLHGVFPSLFWNAANVAHRCYEVNVAQMLRVQSVPSWNDAPGRTKAEVVAKLRDAARNA